MKIQYALILTGVAGSVSGFALSSSTASAATESRYIAPQGGQSFGSPTCVMRDWWHLGVPSSCGMEYVDWALSREAAHTRLKVNVKYRLKDEDLSCSIYSVPSDGYLGYVTSATAKAYGTSRAGNLAIPEVRTPGAYTASLICTMRPEHKVYGLFQYSHDDY